MDLYSILRSFADSWGLLAMGLFFVGSIIWVLRPGSSEYYNEAADIPFQNEDKPLIDEESAK